MDQLLRLPAVPFRYLFRHFLEPSFRGTQNSKPNNRSLPLIVAGSVALVASSFVAWTTYFKFAGDLDLGLKDLGWKPEGMRTYVLLLAVSALLLAFVPVRGRRFAGLALSAGLTVLCGLSLIAILIDGATIATVDSGGAPIIDPGTGASFSRGTAHVGPYLATAGAILLWFGFAAMKDRREVSEAGRENPIADVIAVALSVFAGLGGLVYSLKVEEPTRFLAALAAFAIAVVTLKQLGVTHWLRAAAQKRRGVTIAIIALAAGIFPFTQDGSGYWLRVLCTVLFFSCAAVGLNVVVGLAGLLDLGYIAFFGIGAYVAGVLGNAGSNGPKWHLPFVLVIVIGAVVAAIAGVIIGAPTLRLEGDYLAIVTLGFGEIFRISVNNGGNKVTGGPPGIANIPDPNGFGWDFGKTHKVLGVELHYFSNYYFLGLLMLAAVVFIFGRLNTSRVGRAWVAIREDELAARAMGINTTSMKLLAFALGAFLAGGAGTASAHLGTQVSPDSFTFNESILLLAAVVLGGMGTVSGAILGAAALYMIPEKLRFFQDKRLLLFGVALVLMMRFRPAGIIVNRRNRMRAEDSQADARSVELLGAEVAQ
jgi:branched-chain amino acid transport system permease protein